MKGSANAFAKAREEIQFWPSAGLAYYYTIESSWFVLILFFVTIWTGATTYKLHETIRKLKTKQRSKAEVRARKSRDKKSENYSGLLSSGTRFWDTLSPDSPTAILVVVVGMVINLFAGAVLWLWMFFRVISSSSPHFTEVTLFSLPLVLLATIVASIVWVN